MSATLIYHIVRPTEGTDVAYQTKSLLARRYCNTDGSIGHDFALSAADLPWLEGALAASNEKDVQGDLRKIINLLDRAEVLAFRFEH